jgi:glycosyltransferase involved in cell wall biosynthesis
MKKIAYMLDNFPVYSETFILREILELKRKGFDVLVMARNNTVGNPSFSEVIHPEAQRLMKDVYYFPLSGPEISRARKIQMHLYFFLRNPGRYLKTFLFSYRSDRQTLGSFKNLVLYAMKLRNEGVGHIHAHFAHEACKLTMLISMLTNIPYSFTIHAYDIFLPELSNLMEEKFDHAKFVACISKYNKEFVLAKYPGIHPEKIKIIHCGLDLVAFDSTHKTRNTVLTLISVGRLTEQKGFKYLIQACKVLKARKSFDFVCHIIGSGKQRQELEELIRKSDLEDTVHLLGAMEQASVLNALNSADLFILPCVILETGRRDGIPVALMEAMAMEIPVISTEVSGIPELVRDGAGIVVEPGNVDALAMAIEKVIRLQAIERQELGKRGRAIIEREFNLAREVDKLAGLFVS